MPYEPIVPEGHHLGTSRIVDGAVTGHIFEDGTNDLKGHAAWQWVDEPEASYTSSFDESSDRELTPEERELIEQATALILAIIVLGVQTAAPYVKRWWGAIVLPRVERTWRRLTRRKSVADGFEPVELLHIVEAELEDAPGPGSGVVLANPRLTMTSSEWSERYRAMITAARFRDEQAQILRNAQVVDQAAVTNAFGAEELTPKQFVDRLRSMLAAHPELLTDETVIELKRLLRSSP